MMKKLKDERKEACREESRPSGWSVRPVLPVELLRDEVPSREAFVARLKERKDTSRVISILSKLLPSPQHLKRCSPDGRIFLGWADLHKDAAQEVKNHLLSIGFDLSLLTSVELATAAAVAPMTKNQMIQASKHWPLNFHPDLRLEALLRLTSASGSDVEKSAASRERKRRLDSMESCMRLAISAANVSAVGVVSTESGLRCTGSAVLVDPQQARILTVAASSVHEHPMWHASMLAIDLVARLQGGGCLLPKSIVEDASISAAGGGKRKLRIAPPLAYPVSLLSDIQLPSTETLTFEDSTFKSKKEKNEETRSGSYLCTNYWIFLLQEPCPMCAMALLHSRVAKVFYGAPNKESGILGSRALLHSLPGLNHRYEVWTGILETECIEAARKCPTASF